MVGLFIGCMPTKIFSKILFLENILPYIFLSYRYANTCTYTWTNIIPGKFQIHPMSVVIYIQDAKYPICTAPMQLTNSNGSFLQCTNHIVYLSSIDPPNSLCNQVLSLNRVCATPFCDVHDYASQAQHGQWFLRMSSLLDHERCQMDLIKKILLY